MLPGCSPGDRRGESQRGLRSLDSARIEQRVEKLDEGAMSRNNEKQMDGGRGCSESNRNTGWLRCHGVRHGSQVSASCGLVPPPPELGNPARGPGMERKKKQSSGLSHAQCDALEIPKYKDNVNDVI